MPETLHDTPAPGAGSPAAADAAGSAKSEGRSPRPGDIRTTPAVGRRRPAGTTPRSVDHRGARRPIALIVVAVLGVAGTVGFGTAWSSQRSR
ncbi:MAG TPA: hypothetical protein VGM93_13850, partial [Acidimicrobiales bacterium]